MFHRTRKNIVRVTNINRRTISLDNSVQYGWLFNDPNMLILQEADTEQEAINLSLFYLL